MSLYFKTLENKISVDPDKISGKIFPCLKRKIALKYFLI